MSLLIRIRQPCLLTACICKNQIYMHSHTHTYIHTYTDMHIPGLFAPAMYNCECMHTISCVCVYIYIYIYMSLCVCIYIYIYIYDQMHMYMYIYTYIYTLTYLSDMFQSHVGNFPWLF